MKTALTILLALSLSSNAQLDTAALNDNTWVSLWAPGDGLSLTGNNWAYENDWIGHPFYGFFVMGPGHFVHPQDCYFYPFDPVKKRWTKMNSPRRSPRQCLSSFTINSQDTVILHLGGSEGSHNQGQGAWNDLYSMIDLGGKRSSRLWAYSFNRNFWYNMRGPIELPRPQYSPQPQYDPVHDLLIVTQGDSTWLYNFHTNTTKRLKSPISFPYYYYSCAVDSRRGLYYILYMNYLRCFNPETESWSVIPGAQPPCPANTAGANGIGLNMMAYDDVNDVMVYTGDDNEYGPPNLNTWVFDCDSLKWAKLTTATAPQDRGRLAYSRPLNAFVTLGAASTGAISRGGSTKGMWAYRYKRGPGVFAGRPLVPAAAIHTEAAPPTLSWKTLSGATGYHVYRGLANPFPKGFVKITSTPITDTFYADASAATATPYVYKIYGMNGSIEGEPSRILYARPGRVLGTVASVEDTFNIKVSWDPVPAGTVLYYNVYRAKGVAYYTPPFPGPGFTKVNAQPVYGTEFNDTSMATRGFRDGYCRGYIVTAVNGLGLESGPSPECTSLPDSPEWAHVSAVSTPQGQKMAFRWQPPRRNKIIGVNLYRIHAAEETTPDSMVRLICGGGGFWSPIYTYATRQNGTKTVTAYITDTVTNWSMPPTPVVVDANKTGYYLQGQTYIAKALNFFRQEGFCTDQISPNNQEYGTGIVASSLRFNYNDWCPPGVLAEDGAEDPGESQNGLSIRPNPCNPAITLAFRAQRSGTAGIRVLDARGRTALTENMQARPGLNHRRLRLDGLSAGLYVIEIRCDGRRLTQRAALVR